MPTGKRCFMEELFTYSAGFGQCWKHSMKKNKIERNP